MTPSWLNCNFLRAVVAHDHDMLGVVESQLAVRRFYLDSQFRLMGMGTHLLWSTAERHNLIGMGAASSKARTSVGVSQRAVIADESYVQPSSSALISPVMGAASLKARTSVAASCPVIASTTSSVSVGWMAFFAAASSPISLLSICSRPAVSTMTASRPSCEGRNMNLFDKPCVVLQNFQHASSDCCYLLLAALLLQLSGSAGFRDIWHAAAALLSARAAAALQIKCSRLAGDPAGAG